MNLKCPIQVTKAVKDFYLKYVEETGYTITIKKSRNLTTWMSDHPRYGKLTPVAESYGKKNWIYIRLEIKPL